MEDTSAALNEKQMFGDRLLSARKAADMSQEELGNRLGVSLQAVQQWEEGATEPSVGLASSQKS